jgi:hypothetical protein
VKKHQTEYRTMTRKRDKQGSEEIKVPLGQIFDKGIKMAKARHDASSTTWSDGSSRARSSSTTSSRIACRSRKCCTATTFSTRKTDSRVKVVLKP